MNEQSRLTLSVSILTPLTAGFLLPPEVAQTAVNYVQENVGVVSQLDGLRDLLYHSHSTQSAEFSAVSQIMQHLAATVIYLPVGVLTGMAKAVYDHGHPGNSAAYTVPDQLQLVHELPENSKCGSFVAYAAFEQLFGSVWAEKLYEARQALVEQGESIPQAHLLSLREVAVEQLASKTNRDVNSVQEALEEIIKREVARSIVKQGIRGPDAVATAEYDTRADFLFDLHSYFFLNAQPVIERFKQRGGLDLLYKSVDTANIYALVTYGTTAVLLGQPVPFIAFFSWVLGAVSTLRDTIQIPQFENTEARLSRLEVELGLKKTHPARSVGI